MKNCALSNLEQQVLDYLLHHRNRTITRHELLENVWRQNPNLTLTRTVDMHIAKLRAKLGDSSGKIIRTVRGQGYLLQEQLTPLPA